MTDTGSLLQAMALMPAVANPYLVSLRTGTQLDADTLHTHCNFHQMDAMLLDVRNRLSQIDFDNAF